MTTFPSFKFKIITWVTWKCWRISVLCKTMWLNRWRELTHTTCNISIFPRRHLKMLLWNGKCNSSSPICTYAISLTLQYLTNSIFSNILHEAIVHQQSIVTGVRCKSMILITGSSWGIKCVIADTHVEMCNSGSQTIGVSGKSRQRFLRLQK